MINVAIVEDEQEAVEYLSDCLHRYGEKTGETFSFTHFPEPITFLEKYKPVYDLVFMDIRMPMMDGMQAAKKLREADTSVLLVFVTRMGDYLDYHIKCNTAPKKERHCVRFVLE